MRNTRQRIFGMLLAVTLLLGTFGGFPLTAYAAGGANVDNYDYAYDSV